MILEFRLGYSFDRKRMFVGAKSENSCICHVARHDEEDAPYFVWPDCPVCTHRFTDVSYRNDPPFLGPAPGLSFSYLARALPSHGNAGEAMIFDFRFELDGNGHFYCFIRDTSGSCRCHVYWNAEGPRRFRFMFHYCTPCWQGLRLTDHEVHMGRNIELRDAKNLLLVYSEG